MKNIFRQIIDREQPADIVFENENVIAIRDIHPLAPVHILIIPKKEYKSLQSIPAEEVGIVSEIVRIAQNLATQLNIANHYRFLTNIGSDSGQSVFHLHFHLIGGKRLGPMA